MSEGDRGYRPEIDGLRAIAVMAVILFHVGLGPFTGGYVGVDVFFVISGYLIVGIVWRQCEKGQFRLGEFYRRRVLRLFPALLLVCVATMAVSVLVLLPSDFMRLGQSLAATMGYVSNIWLWRNTGYFDARAETLPLLHTWSLSVEEQFYMVFPVALLLLHRHLRARAVALLVTLGVVTLAATQYFLVSRQSAVFYLTPFRAWEFLLGGVLAVTATAPRAAWLRSVARWTALALVLAPAFVYDSHTDFPGLTAVAPCVGAALLLISVGPDDRDVVSRALRSRPFVLVGKLSYSLYLWHWPVLVLWTHADQRPESPLAMAAVVVITFSLSAISYRLVETPLRQADAPHAGRVLWGSLAASVALAVVALVVGVGDGVPSRFSEPVVALDRARFPDVPFTPCFGPALVGGDCTLGVSTAAPRWLLWGDSHALALAPALDATLKKRGEAAVFIAGSACPPLWGVGSRDVRSGDWRCDELGARVDAALRPGGSIDAVILVAIWPDYFSGKDCRLRDAGGERGNAEVMAAALPDTLARLNRQGLRTIVVGRVPRHPFVVPYEMARAARAGRPSLPGVTVADERTAQAAFAATLGSLSRRAGFELVDPVAHFCASGACRYSVDGRPLYRDAHHLNLEGATEAMALVEVAMDRIPKGRVDADSSGH